MGAHRFLAAAAMLAIAADAYAQGNNLSAFAQYLKSNANRDVIKQVIRAQAARYPGACKDVAFDEKFNVILIAPVLFDGQRFKAGAWKETVQATSCGKSRVHNVHTFVRRDGALQRSPMLPGSTIADFMLQNDAARMAYINVAASAKDCPAAQHFIEDTKFISWDSKRIANAKAGPEARAWDEEWTASACGKPIVLSVRFTPDATGTGFAVKAKR